MTSSMTGARNNRESVQFFDVDVFRNKLENYMRKQSNEMCEPVNNKKRKFSERWSDMDKEEMELAEDYRDDLCFQFNKRQRFYPLDDDELEMEEVSPLALPSPVSVFETESSTSQPWPFNNNSSHFSYLNAYLQPQSQSQSQEDPDPMSLAMRRQLTGYSEVSSTNTIACNMDADDDSWMSPCPPLSRGSISYASSTLPSTPQNGLDSSESDQLMSNIEQCNALNASSFENPSENLDLDLGAMAPHERQLLAALAPERFEKAALIKKAFRQSEKMLDQFAREHQTGNVQDQNGDVQMDESEYDQVFGELMHV